MKLSKRSPSAAVEALKFRQDWQARYSQVRIAKLTATICGLGVIIVPGAARQFFGATEDLPLIFLISMAMGAVGATLIWSYAHLKLPSYRTELQTLRRREYPCCHN